MLTSESATNGGRNKQYAETLYDNNSLKSSANNNYRTGSKLNWNRNMD